MYIDIEIYKGDDNIFVAACPDFNLFSHAETQDEAVEKLKIAITSYLKNDKPQKDIDENIEFGLKYNPSPNQQAH